MSTLASSASTRVVAVTTARSTTKVRDRSIDRRRSRSTRGRERGGRRASFERDWYPHPYPRRL